MIYIYKNEEIKSEMRIFFTLDKHKIRWTGTKSLFLTVF